MPRPLMQCGVSQLEEMFTKGKSAPKVLKQLERELQFRHVPRAVALLGEVQAAMQEGILAATPTTETTRITLRVPAATLDSKQPDLWEPSSAPPVAAPKIRTVPVTAKPQGPLPALRPAVSVLTMALDDAYNVLKATPGASWESIEQTRRTLVELSHPSRSNSLSPEKRTLALVKAKRVNAAYSALSQARCDGR